MLLYKIVIELNIKMRQGSMPKLKNFIAESHFKLLMYDNQSVLINI